MNHSTIAGAFVTVAALLLPVAGHADSDHDRARAALVAGEVLPLPVVLERVGKTYPGNVLEVELEQRKERWVYELKLLQSGGRLLRLEVDAKDGEVLRMRDRGGKD